MTYKITVQDGPVSVTVETEVADEAAAVLAVSVLQKVQRSRHFEWYQLYPHLPRQPNCWDGPDKDWWRKGAEARGAGNTPPSSMYAAAELAVAKQQL